MTAGYTYSARSAFEREYAELDALCAPLTAREASVGEFAET